MHVSNDVDGIESRDAACLMTSNFRTSFDRSESSPRSSPSENTPISTVMRMPRYILRPGNAMFVYITRSSFGLTGK